MHLIELCNTKILKFTKNLLKTKSIRFDLQTQVCQNLTKLWVLGYFYELKMNITTEF